MGKPRILNIAVLVITCLMIGVNVIGISLPLNGVTGRQVADRFAVYFIPSGFSFLIWGLFYSGLFVFSIFQVLPAQRGNPTLQRISGWYIGLCLVHIARIILWRYELIVLSLMATVVMLIELIVIYMKLEIGVNEISHGMRYFVNLVFSLLLGWMTITTIASVTVVLFHLGWDGLGVDPKLWAVMMMVVAVVISEVVAYNRRDLPFMTVIVWGLVGIGINSHGTSPVTEAAYVSAAIVTLMAILTLVVRPRKKPQNRLD